MKETVLYFFDYGSSYGGAVHTLRQQMLLMRECGYQVYGFVSDYNGTPMQKDYEAMFLADNMTLETITYPICSHTEDIDIVETLRCYEEVKAVIQRYQPAILHSVQINPAVELVSREMGIPHIMNIYPLCDDFFALPYTNVFPQYHTCDSLYFAEAWQKRLGIRSFCVRVSVSKFRPREHITKKDKIRAVCVGLISVRKNQLAVIQGTHQAILQGADITLELYGSDLGEYADQCRQYIAEHHLEDRICVRGFCTEILDIYENADVLICGSRLESYPNVIAEALANGVAVVSTPVAGVSEVIKDGENGFLCSGYAVEDLTEKIVEAYQAFQDGSIQGIQQRAEDTFRHTHSAEQVSAELQRVYRLVMEQGVHGGLPGIREIRAKFEGFLNLYRVHEGEFLKPDFVRKKLWYLYHVNPLIHAQMKKGRKLYIWGAGKIGACILQMNRLMELGWQIEGFVDGSRSGDYMEYPVSRPEERIPDREAVILIAFLAGTNEAMEQLQKAGRSYAEDYFLLTPRHW